MKVTIGGLALSNHLLLDLQGAGVGYSQRRLIGGSSCVQVDGSNGGQTIVLSGINHWARAQFKALRSMQSLGKAIELIHYEQIFTVVIIDTKDLQPTRQYFNPADTDMYTGSITMIEV